MAAAAASNWLNWRFLLCVVWVLVSMNISVLLIWRRKKKKKNGDEQPDDGKIGGEGEEEISSNQAWKPCLKCVHPAWLLAFRLCAFSVLLLLLVAIVLVDGAVMFYYYTQWTLTLVTLYFAMGSLISIRGCYEYSKMGSVDVVGNTAAAELGDAEHGGGQSSMKDSNSAGQAAGGWGCALFQIIFQISGGAVMLTDIVFWFVIFPFLAIKDKRLNLLIVSMHSMNAIFLLGDTAMNCLPFPFFRIGYFIMWTILYVLFQWILHASVKIWWPYPFLDISSPSVPVWYLAVAAIHVPCYGMFACIVKLKNTLFVKWFRDSYRGFN
ncbi:unnamed protein product [Linum tenue]|uniref:Uncharacterized protein n=1 Tax=Linum tenue TaxID=586396 RepID=A0AAV0QPB6_9ROSI|nr:unnamed protein product [Linum tenue]